jgi:7-cyano-7-deazaguanine synthase
VKHKSIILLSGGLDSTVSATIAKMKTRPLLALTFDYGQHAAAMEIKASKKICARLEIPHEVVNLPFFKRFKKLRLLKSRKKVNIKDFIRIKDVWIPNRNGLFINIAACFAEYYNANMIVTGFNKDEAREFPDNTKQFTAAINRSLKHSTLCTVVVKSFVAHKSKKQIYNTGIQIKAPLEYIYSCYLGGKKMCGSCASCKRLFAVSKNHEL